MSFLALNLLLALVWTFLLGDLSFAGLATGFVVGFGAITLSRPLLGSRRYVRAVLGTVRLLAGFTRELVLANLHLARDILRPTPPFRPGFVRYDARDLGPRETVLLANLVSLTPGTVTVDVDDAGDTLYLHTLYAGDPREVRAGVRRLADLVRAATGHDPVPPPEEV
ncbi:MAG: Na+/H+ antiporter subunit E [Gemmatimonadota bacterium]